MSEATRIPATDVRCSLPEESQAERRKQLRSTCARPPLATTNDDFMAIGASRESPSETLHGFVGLIRRNRRVTEAHPLSVIHTRGSAGRNQHAVRKAIFLRYGE